MILVTAPVLDYELRVITAATRAKVAHVIKITSSASPDSPIARRRDQSVIEAALIASGLNHTLLRNNVRVAYAGLGRSVGRRSQRRVGGTRWVDSNVSDVVDARADHGCQRPTGSKNRLCGLTRNACAHQRASIELPSCLRFVDDAPFHRSIRGVGRMVHSRGR